MHASTVGMHSTLTKTNDKTRRQHENIICTISFRSETSNHRHGRQSARLSSDGDRHDRRCRDYRAHRQEKRSESNQRQTGSHTAAARRQDRGIIYNDHSMGTKQTLNLRRQPKKATKLVTTPGDYNEKNNCNDRREYRSHDIQTQRRDRRIKKVALVEMIEILRVEAMTMIDATYLVNKAQTGDERAHRMLIKRYGKAITNRLLQEQT